MSKRFWLSVFLVAGTITGPAMAQSIVPLDPATITNGNVYLMDNVGANLPDDSANNTNGILIGGPQAVAGLNGGALKFNGTSSGVQLPDAATINTSIHQDKTVIAVFNCADVSKTEKQCVYEEGGSTRGLTIYVHQGLVYAAGWNRADYTPQWNPGTFLSAPIRSNEWHVVAAVLRGGTAGQTNDKFEMWLDGALIDKGPGGELRSRSDDNGIANVQQQTNFHDGTVNAGYWFEGMIDEIWILNQALSEDVLSAIGLSRTIAANPVPAAGATDALRDGILSWDAGEFARTHDVYLGTTFADVNTAGRTDAKGALASQGQTATTYDPPGLLAYGQTYYWRIDEVNQAPDNTIFKGDVWSFTVEPYGYPLQPTAVTASSYQAGMGPEKTIDGSGLTGDLHGTEPTTMWLSAGVPPNWIQYEFDNVYKLHEMVVWNSNQLVEAFVGFGAKSVIVETSTDGTTWTPVANVPEFGRAPGATGYAANTTVNLGSVEAKYVKLTISANWGGTAPQTGLSEVRFAYVPVQARAPQPATAATGVSVDTALDWRPGREAASHKVFFGTDPNAVAQGTASAKTVTDHGYTPDALNLGTTYYWKVDEVNAVTYPGDVWSFTTQEYKVVDDFESYTDKPDEEVFTAWVDGMVNGNGSIVGLYPTAVNGTFCEKTIIHGGKQSMPFEYNNVKTPFYSEAERTFDTPQNWTGNGADTLVVYFQGQAMAFQEKSAGTIVMSGGGTDIWNTADQFRFAGKRLSGDGTIVAKVESLVNTDPWAKVGVMIRESLDPGSRFAAVYATPGNGVRYQARLTTSAAAVSDTSVVTTEQTALQAPVWVKIERSGTAFNGFYSTDGVKWTAMSWNPQTINVTAASLYIGLAVTSHNANAVTTAEFSNISTTGTVTGAWEVAEIGVAQPSNTPDPLYLIVQDTAGKSTVVSHPDPLATTVASWQAWQIPLSELSSAGIKLTAVKKMILGVGEKASPKPGGAGKLYIDDIGFGHPASTNP